MNDERIEDTPDDAAATDGAGARPAPDHADGERRRAGDRPLGFWLKAVDRRIDAEVEAALADLDVSRRDWRRLNLIAGEVRDEQLLARIDARPHKLDELVERGWVAGAPGDWSLTDSGRAALDDLAERVGAIRARVAASVTDDDYATTVASLEAIARELGWDESAPMPGRRGPRGAGFGGRPGPWMRRGAARRGMPPWFADAPHGGPKRHPHRGDGVDHGTAEHPAHPHGDHPCAEHPHPHRGRRGAGRRDDVHVHVHLHDDDDGRRHGRGR